MLHIRRQLTEYVRIRSGGVGERLKPAVLKNETPFCIWQKNQLDPFASRKIATICVFWLAPFLLLLRDF
jgi:hypothetical protein